MQKWGILLCNFGELYYAINTANEITVEGKDFIIPGNTQGECLVELTAPDGTDREIEVTVVAVSLDDDFRAEIKASLIIRN